MVASCCQIPLRFEYCAADVRCCATEGDTTVATLEGLISLTRGELVDMPRPFQASVRGDGITSRFELPDKPIDGDSLLVFRRDNETSTTTAVTADAYTVSEDEGVITFNAPPADTDTIVVQGTAFRFFSDSTIQGFVERALEKHNNRTIVTVDTLPAVEEHLVAIRAKIEGLWRLATDVAYGIDVYAPEGTTIPRSQRYRQLMAQIAEEQARLRNMSQQLNVGLERVEVGTLRRISTKTGRLVPLYVAQEYDDRRRPQRIYPGIDVQATTVRPDYLPPLPPPPP